MISQKHRFHGYGSLRFLYRNGQSVRSSLVTLKYIANPRRKNSRFTVVVSKKVMKSAVKRNRIRRRIYEVIRQEIPTIKDGYDTAVMVFSSDILRMDHESLVATIKQLLSQAKLYK